MTLSSSLNAGVAGLNVNASKLATVSDNIANSGTYGYKRAVADFTSMVIDQTRGSYSAGGVRVTTHRMVDQQGTLVNTDNPTDLAIAGRGMLPVTNLTALDSTTSGAYPLMLTTTGSFRPDSSGVLRTDTGLVLMGWPAQPNGTIPSFPRTTAEGMEPVRVNLNQFAGDPTTQVELGLNLPATATQAGETGDTLDFPVEYFNNLGTSQNLTIEFTPTLPANAGDPATNEWQIVIKDEAQAGATVGDFTVTFDGTQSSGGAISSVIDNTLATPGPGAYDEATGKLTITVDGGGTMQIDIGRYNDTRGLTQLSNAFAPVAVNKNGSPVGNLSSVEIDANGFLHAIYDIGFTKKIYQIPVVDVPNPNGLIAQSNQAFEVSPDSGSFFLWDAGDGPTGDMAGFTREESATDVAAELTQLIQTQRAYSSNAKIIQTVDEMLQETTNIKR